MRGEVIFLAYSDAVNFLLPRHYSGRKPCVSRAFGWMVDGEIKAVCSFGKPASPNLCKGVMRGEFSSQVYELNRLCRLDDFSEPLSQFVATCLRRLSTENLIIVSYADTGMGHNGYIYQACNFIYTGLTKERTDKYTEGNKHSRHYQRAEQDGKRKVRTAKHRYIFFCTRNRKLRKEWTIKLAYSIKPFPKGENQNYRLGDFMVPKVVADELHG